MTTYPARLAAAMLAALLLAVLAFVTLSRMSAPVRHTAAEWCTYVDPAYYKGQPITPSGEYCVPGP